MGEGSCQIFCCRKTAEIPTAAHTPSLCGSHLASEIPERAQLCPISPGQNLSSLYHILRVARSEARLFLEASPVCCPT